MFFTSSFPPSRGQVQWKAWPFQQNNVPDTPTSRVNLSTPEAHSNLMKDVTVWKKPPGMKVVALIFYGRRRYVSVLECYLKVGCSTAG